MAEYDRNDSKIDDAYNAEAIGRSLEDKAVAGYGRKAGDADSPGDAQDREGQVAEISGRDSEQGGGFRNSVVGREKKNEGGVKGKIKKLGPLGLILLLLGLGGGLFAGSQIMAPFGFVVNAMDQFNVLRTSMNRRTTFLMRAQLDTTRNKPLVKYGVFSDDSFAISGSMSKKLAKNGITYNPSYNGGVRVLEYESGRGGKILVAANEADAARVGGITLDQAMAEFDDFNLSVDKSTRTLKGHIAGWFDSVSEKFHSRIENSRNRFKDADKTASDEEIVEDAKKTGMDEDVRSSTDEGDGPEEIEEVEVKDEDGNVTTEEERKKITGDTDLNKDTSTSEIEERLKNRGRKVAASLNNINNVMEVANFGCAAMKVVSAIDAAIAAVHVAKVLNYVTGFLEAVQKTQIGDAGQSELSYYMTGLSQKGATTVIGSDGVGQVVPGKENTSSLESPAWNSFFGGGAISAGDPVAQKFNRDSIAAMSYNQGLFSQEVAQGLTALGGSIAAYKTCVAMQAAAGVTGAIADIVGNIVSSGGAVVVKGIIKAGLLAALMLGVSGFISAIVPHVAQWLAIDLIENMAGEDAAYAINSGVNMYMGGQMQAASGKPGTYDEVMAYYRETQEVIAEEAEYERSVLSPFDVSSKNTFLGSIVYSMIPVGMALNSSLSSGLSSVLNTTGSAIVATLPGINAMAEETWYELSLNTECPTLSQIGLVGDAYCNPYFVSGGDYSKDPADVFKESIAGSDGGMNFEGVTLDSNGEPVLEDMYKNPQIKERSEFAKYIVACETRQSQFGVPDGSIGAYALPLGGTISGGSTVAATLNEAINVGLGVVPVAGSVIDVVTAISDTANMGWITGENCMDEKYAKYAQYSENQRWMEAADIVDESSIAAFLDKYYEENPIDDSLEGIIARYSGMTYGQVEDVLDTVGYYLFLADYNPIGLGPVQMPPEDSMTNWQFEAENVIAIAGNERWGEAVLTGQAAYERIRLAQYAI